MKINKHELRELILDGISTEELNSKYDYSHITNMSYMFEDCVSLKSVPLFDTSNVIDMQCMFINCASLKTVPLFDTSNVTNMYSMFYNCTSLKSVPELDTSRVTDMYCMFKGCASLKDINPYSFNGFDFMTLDNAYLKEQYPELYV